jgi:competence protein ComGC
MLEIMKIMFHKNTKIIISAIIVFFLIIILIILFIFRDKIFKNDKVFNDANIDNIVATTSEMKIIKNYEELKNSHPEFSSAQLEFYKDAAIKGRVDQCEGSDDEKNCAKSMAFLTEKYFICGDEVLEDEGDQVECANPILSKIANEEIKKCSSIDIIDFRIECLIHIFRVYKKSENCSNFADSEVKKMCESVANYQMAQNQNNSEICEKIENSEFKIYCVAGLSEKYPDSDKDGLSDFEEISKYNADPFNFDTDGDGYKDGDEVKNGFNPNGEGKLIPKQ